MSNLKVGQKVKLIGYPGKTEDKYNPKDTEGTIVSVTGQFNPYIVECSTGLRNSYIAKYLEIV